MNITLLVILIVVNIPRYLGVGKVIFGGWDGFLEALKFWIKPDLMSWFNGEYWEDWAAELKLGLFLVICGVAVWGEYALITRLFLT